MGVMVIMLKSAYVADISNSLLKFNTSTYISSHKIKRKYHVQQTVNDYKYGLSRWRNNLQSIIGLLVCCISAGLNLVAEMPVI